MAEIDRLQYEYFSSVRQRKVEWLWYPYIPYGKLTILQGDPGEGKSTFMLNIAALLTKGKAMPDGYPIEGVQQVVYQTAEDNIADTVKPRLIQAGADCNQIAYIVDEESTLTFSDTRINEVLKRTGARLLILDPLQAYVSQGADLFNAGRMRQQMKRLADMAAEYKCAIVIIGHMNKANGEKSLYRGLGSIDIAAIARSVLMISKDKVDPALRYMYPIKASLAPLGKPIAFRIDSKRGVQWLCDDEVDRRRISDVMASENKTTLCRRVLYEVLSEQDLPSKDIINKLRYMGISDRTANTVKKDLGISSYRKNGTWYWHMDYQGYM